MVETALQCFIAIMIPVVTTILTKLINKALDYQIQKIQNEKLRQLLSEGNDLILNSVRYVQQTYVDDLKASDLFDSEAQNHALTAAKTRALDLMRNEVYVALDKQYSDVDSYIDTIIESAIAKKKEKSL